MDDNSLLNQPVWRIMDQSTMWLTAPAFQSFAMDDTLCALAGRGGAPASVRTWVHDRTIVLGIQDTKLPYLEAGVEFLKQRGYRVVVRNSGGLAVVLDSGVLNISLIFPETGNRIDINRGYDTMWELVRRMLADAPVPIEAREISGSYCPGSYDLSVGGRKFAGISQRRIRSGIAVQIYLCLNGSGAERAALIREFYRVSGSSEPSKFHYPEIRPEVMASLEELLGGSWETGMAMQRLLEVLQKTGGKLEPFQLGAEELPLYEDYLARIIERNEKAFDGLK